MGFFEDVEPPPPPPEPVQYRSPPWSGPPDNVVPATVALDVLVVRTPAWAVWIGHGSVTPEGMEFTVTILGRRSEPAPGAMGPLFDGTGADVPRLGVGFDDGRRAVSDGRPSATHPTGDRATEIMLWPRGGSGSQRHSSRDFWLWPLPPPGSLTFAMSWPEQGLDEVVVEVDAAPIREAAGRAVELWPDDRPLPPPPGEGGPGWAAYT
ncbi:MAG: hypothetical protein JWP53_1358 [Conexibacter sp.]|jgi:hypothetical protein|nr:hypothetical protein [Conexibacter sp.]